MNDFENERSNRKLRGAFNLSWMFILMIVLAGLLVFFVENIAQALLPKTTTSWDFFWAAVIVALLIFLVFYWQHDRIARQVSATATIIRASEINDRPYLICGYSPVPTKPDRCGKRTGPMLTKLSDLSNDIVQACSKDISESSKLGSWQQNLRVLNTLKGVRHLYVIQPSCDQFNRFSEILRHYFSEDRLSITLVTDKTGNTTIEQGVKESLSPDYEDFRYVTVAINRALEMIAEDPDRKISMAEAEASTVIDVTGGLKTFSIAGAISSLNRKLIFVYAGTHGRAGQVLAYDVGIQLSGGQNM